MTRVVLALLVAVVVRTMGMGDVHRSEQSVPAKPEGQPLVLNMELLASRPLVRVNVNGKGPFAFLLSAEDETTQVDRALAAELNVKPQTHAGGGTQIGVTFELGTTKTTVTASVADIAQSFPEFGPAALPRGIMSLSMWEGQLVTIDYSRWRVTITPGGCRMPRERKCSS